MADPIYQRLPETLRALENKNTRNPTLYAGVPGPISNALQQLDLERANLGQNPLSLRQSILAIQAATTGQAATKPPDQGFLDSLVSDIRTLTSSIPRLPAALYQEVKALPQAPQLLSEALSSGNLGNVFQDVPGIRMLPGSYIAGNILGGTPGELAQHPLMTALDVLPVKEIPGVQPVLSKGGKIAKSAITPAARAVGRTRAGQVARETFGTTARDVSQLEAEFSELLRKEMSPDAPPSSDPLVNLARRANSLRTRYPSLSEQRRVELTKLMTEDADSLRTLPGDELSFVHEVRDITDRLGDYGVSKGLLERIDGEIYDTKTAKKVLQSRRRATIYRDITDIRESILTPDPNPATYLDRAVDITHRTDLKPGGKLKYIQGLAHGIEAAGYDAGPLLKDIRTLGKSGYSDAAMRQVLSSYTPVASTAISTADTVATLTPLARTDPTMARLLDHVRSNRWKEARTLAKRIGARTKSRPPDIDSIIERTGIEYRKSRYLDKTRQYTPKAAVRAERTAENTLTKNPPARFHPRIEKDVEARVETLLSTRPDFDRIIPYLREHNWGWLKREGLVSDDELKLIQNEAKANWQDLKRAGFDPVFLHRISPQQTGALTYPRVLETVPKPTSTRARSNDVSPHVQDVSIALPHQALEWLAMRGSEEFISQILSKWGRPEFELLDQYLPAARQRAKFNPSLDVMAHASELMKKEWQRYKPEDIIHWPSPRLSRMKGEELWLPKTVANTIQRFHNPPAGRLTAVFDPVMKVFRTSLLPLSPRWHVYNIIGGGLMLTARTSPTVFRNVKRAYDMVRAGDMPEGLPHGMGTMSGEILEWDAKASFGDKVVASHQFMAGKTLRKLYDQSSQTWDNTAGKFIQKSYNFNGFIDDMYRTMAYLYGQDKTLTRGMSTDAARKAGIELSRKVMQNWDRMTPIERSIMRYVFPFYGWMSHILKYTVSYPWDHPYRTAIMGAFARNELEDMGDALPERFLNMFFLGEPDENGNVSSINLAGMNPFADVSNYFTLAGFMGQVNPIIGATLETVGLDPSSGGPELFPNLRYDPNIGRLAVDTSNPLEKFISATVPQTRILFGLASKSSEFQELLRHDPDAAARLLRSQAGLPVIFRDINIPQEIAKSEIARDEAQSNALNESLRSGDWSAAGNFPNLRPILTQLKALQESGQLEAYTPTPSPGQSKIALAQEALLRMNLP